MGLSQPGWSEFDSASFLEFGRYFVPRREEQIETICARLPGRTDSFRVVELCCGDGTLSHAILDRFPRARILALDRSAAMLEEAKSKLRPWHDRVTFAEFDLASRDWRTFPWPVDAFVSMLALHHLDHGDKRELFTDLYRALAPGGVLVIADVIAPASPAALRIAARAWDESVRGRSLELDGNLRAYEMFRRLKWNLHEHPDPEVDKPAALRDHLRWLGDAGFEHVDVYWAYAGHAVLGGNRPSGP